jgi:outer membrane protein assembly factor BamB
LWRLDLGSTPHTLASFDGTAATGQEILIGTDYGVLVIGADKAVQMNMSLPEPVYAVAGGNFDGDGFEEVVVGCDDFYVYAFEIDTTPLWSYLSNGEVRLIAGADIDSDSRTEVVVASEGKRFTLLQDTGAMVFEKTSTTAINVVAMGDLTAAANWDVVAMEL